MSKKMKILHVHTITGTFSMSPTYWKY